ncbi:hypothetical protein RB595_007365 [Gaeumannomyces hyphopodioides]
MANCAVCEAIARVVATPLKQEFEKRIGLDPNRRQTTWNCKRHLPLFEAINFKPKPGKYCTIEKAKGVPLLGFNNQWLNVVAPEEGHWGLGRIVGDENWIDLAVIQGFLDNCRRNHGKLCESAVFEPSFELPRPAWLIDVEDGCLVKGDVLKENGAEYVTLSYVRGPNTEYFRTTGDNLSAVCQPGALLSDTAGQPRLPKTWRHAIHLTRLLGLRYLWIDLLCLPDQDLEIELRKSAYIISGAAFTIADVDGRDAEHGLRGVRELPDPEPRSFQQKVYHVQHNIVSSPQQPATTTIAVPSQAGLGSVQRHYYPFRADNSSNTDKFKSRAWTRGVEVMLARRLLLFEGGTVRWNCASWPLWQGEFRDVCDIDHMSEDRAHVCHKEKYGCRMSRREEHDVADHDDLDWAEVPLLEDSEVVGEMRAERRWRYGLKNVWPAPHHYFQAFSDISHLAVTSESGQGGQKLLDAAAGIAEAFGRRFEGGFINGIPEAFFDHHMLWQTGSRISRIADISAPPSWSWTGWTGKSPEYDWLLPDPRFDSVDYLIARRCDFAEVISTVPDWATGDRADLAPSARQPVRFYSRISELREQFRDQQAELPTGWTRQRQAVNGSGRMMAPRGYKSSPFVYTHESLPNKWFWYPVPIIAGAQTSGLGGATPQTRPRFLFGTVEMSKQFHVRRKESPEDPELSYAEEIRKKSLSDLPKPHGVVRHPLRDEFGRICGVLEISSGDETEPFRDSAESATVVSVELIAISRGQAKNDVLHEQRVSGGRRNSKFTPPDLQGEWYEFYNVLWIGRWREEAGVRVAERMGIGRVFRSKWEMAMRPNVSVVLS